MRQLIRTEPLETTTLDVGGAALTIPTEAEILRIKGVLILRRNATRDYLDFVALATRMGTNSSGEALRSFDRPGGSGSPCGGRPLERTGWGKSFVYFIAIKPLREAGRGPALLVSPLLSLMRNQIAPLGVQPASSS